MHVRLDALRNASRTVISISETLFIKGMRYSSFTSTECFKGVREGGQRGHVPRPTLSKVCVSVGGGGNGFPLFDTENPPPSLLNRPRVLISLFSHILELKTHNLFSLLY